MGTSCHRCFTRLDPPHFQGVKMANSGSRLRSILETRSGALHFAERNTAWCLPHPWRRYGRDCRWNKGDCRFNYPMRTANSLHDRDKVVRESEWLLSRETDEMTCINWPPAPCLLHVPKWISLTQLAVCLLKGANSLWLHLSRVGVREVGVGEMNNLSG